jgi:lactobin A/cerein 7B family class IIb bacteriocin
MYQVLTTTQLTDVKGGVWPLLIAIISIAGAVYVINNLVKSKTLANSPIYLAPIKR